MQDHIDHQAIYKALDTRCTKALKAYQKTAKACEALTYCTPSTERSLAYALMEAELKAYHAIMDECSAYFTTYIMPKA